MPLRELRHGRQSGMTLVEVTVASLIFAMIMLAVVTAMRTFGQSYERLQQLTDQTAQKREVTAFCARCSEMLCLRPVILMAPQHGWNGSRR